MLESVIDIHFFFSIWTFSGSFKTSSIFHKTLFFMSIYAIPICLIGGFFGSRKKTVIFKTAGEKENREFFTPLSP